MPATRNRPSHTWRLVTRAVGRQSARAWWLVACALVLAVLGMLLQQRLRPSLSWALLDELTHASVAVIVAAWLVPSWGVRPLLVAVVAATAIDLDHALAAGSLDVYRLMSLGARPITHSLPAALVIGGLVGLTGGWRLGYAAALGMVSHVLHDSLGPPGVPLWLLDGNPHVVLPGPVVVGAVIGLAALSLIVSRVSARRAAAPPAAPSARDAQMTPV